MIQHSTTKLNAAAAPQPPGLAWFMRRAAIGVSLLFVFVFSIAWLTHTSLQADTEATAISTDEDQLPPAEKAQIIRAVAPATIERQQAKAE